jgi:hypothetical protein
MQQDEKRVEGKREELNVRWSKTRKPWLNTNGLLL